MKVFILTTIAIFLLTAAASAQTAETVTVKLGQQKTAGNSGLKVSFLKLIEDSRCPANAKCVWAGNAKIKISVSRSGKSTKTFELNTGLDPKSVTAFGCEIRITELNPYPGLPNKAVRGKLVAFPQTVTLSIKKAA